MQALAWPGGGRVLGGWWCGEEVGDEGCRRLRGRPTVCLAGGPEAEALLEPMA